MRKTTSTTAKASRQQLAAATLDKAKRTTSRTLATEFAERSATFFSLRWPCSDRLLDSVGIVLGTRGAPRSDLKDTAVLSEDGTHTYSHVIT